MKNEIAVSVVVPVYKVKKYLRECVDSVLAQTFTDFELILVDDGSPDNSGKICDEYAKKDPRVRVFHQENGGVSSARKLGVENARGEWISFVDADDMLLPDGLATLYRFIDAETDLVEAQATTTLTPPPLDEISDADSPHVALSGREFVLDLLQNDSPLWGAVWSKLYRKSVLLAPEILKIPHEFTMGEDFILNFRFAKNCTGKIKKTQDIVYFYRSDREDSATKRCVYESYYFRFFGELKRSAGTLLTPQDQDFFAFYAHKQLLSVFRSPSPFTCSKWAKVLRPAGVNKAFAKKVRFSYFSTRTYLALLLRLRWKLRHRKKLKKMSSLPVLK